MATITLFHDQAGATFAFDDASGALLIGHADQTLVPLPTWGTDDDGRPPATDDDRGDWLPAPITVDRRGPGVAAGRARSADLGPDLHWAVVDLGSSYRGLLHRYFRYLLVAAPDTFLVVDDVLADEPRDLVWTLPYEGDLTLGAGAFTIARDGSRAEVRFPTLDPGRQRYRLTEETWLSCLPGVTARASFATLSPLPRSRRWVLPAVVVVGGEPLPPRRIDAVAFDEHHLTFRVGPRALRLDLRGARLLPG
jgi:hypothetical protein